MTKKQWVVLCAMVLVLSLVCVIIFGETKQHSPYQRGRNVMKSLLVLNHSVFFALIMGCFMQFVFYNNLLKTSDALSEVVYKDHFKQLERQLDDMEALENSIKEYRIFAREYDFNHKRISGTNAGKTGIKGNISFYNHESLIDSAELKLENRIVMESSMVSTIGKEIHVYHNELVDDITNCAETDSAFKGFYNSAFFVMFNRIGYGFYAIIEAFVDIIFAYFKFVYSLNVPNFIFSTFGIIFFLAINNLFLFVVFLHLLY